jgi:hypothetical protein
MTKELFVLWQIPNKNKWLPIGKLLYEAKKYIFKYTIGAEWARNNENFIAFSQMNDFKKIYKSDELFPLFKNRLLPKTRPEYQKYLNWLDLDENNYSYFEELSRTGGSKATDSFRILQIPENKNGKYEVTFFINGIRDLTPNSINRIDKLEKNRSLYLMRDIQNKVDSSALVLRTDDPAEIVGYCPAFFVDDFNKLIEINHAENVKLSVVKVNSQAPLQFRLLCKLSTLWPSDFISFDQEAFQTIIN